MTVDLGFEIYNDDYDTSVHGELLHVDVFFGPGGPLNAVPQGITLLEEDGITVQAVDLISGSDGTSLSLYVQNDTGRTVTLNAVQARCNRGAGGALVL